MYWKNKIKYFILLLYCSTHSEDATYMYKLLDGFEHLHIEGFDLNGGQIHVT